MLSYSCSSTVYRDVENIEPLTKNDMLEFFKAYYHPHSPTRAKASVHLIAQASAADIAAKTSSAEKREKLVDMVTQMLQQMGLEEANTEDLAKRMEKVDVAAADTQGILGAIGGYLKDTAGMAADQVEKVLEQGQVVLTSVLPSLGIVSQEKDVGGEIETNGEVANGDKPNKTVLIEDVKAFKARMPLSAGATPVKDLSEFEELEAKL